MSGPNPPAIFNLFRSQLTFHPSAPTSSFASQTVIVTGGNAGLGREAAKYIVQLGAEKVIITARDLKKGEAAKECIESETGRKGVVEVWELDLGKWESVRGFASRVEKGCDRVDAVIENAGMWATKSEIVEGFEATITTNVLSTCLLANLLLPILVRTATKYPDSTPRLTFVGSALCKFATLKARRNKDSIFDSFRAEERTLDFDMRYNDSKLLLLLYAQKLESSIPAPSDKAVSITVVNPGYCLSALKPPQGFGQRAFEKAMARSTAQGAYLLVDAVAKEKVQKEGRWGGAYLDDAKMYSAGTWVEKSEDAKVTRERVWKEVNEITGVDGTLKSA